MIIPPTGTPGAAAAGVPEYIDRVVSLNAEHQPLIRAGLAWLERQAKARFSREFLALSEAEHVAILQPLSDESRSPAARGAACGGSEPRRRGQRCITSRSPTGIRRHGLATARRPRSKPTLACPSGSSASIKNLTADGYYTSRVGLLEELGYAGNTALGAFPACPEQ